MGLLTPPRLLHRRKDETNCCMHNSFIASTSLTKACASCRSLLALKEISLNFFINFLLHSALERKETELKAPKPKHMLETLACEALKVILKVLAENVIDSICAYFLLFSGEMLHVDTESGKKLIQPVEGGNFSVELIKQISMTIKKVKEKTSQDEEENHKLNNCFNGLATRLFMLFRRNIKNQKRIGRLEWSVSHTHDING